MYSITTSNRSGRIISDEEIPPETYGDEPLHRLCTEDLIYFQPVKHKLRVLPPGWILALWLDYEVKRAFKRYKNNRIVELSSQSEVVSRIGIE